MLFAALVPTRWRRNYDITDPNKPGFYNPQITPFLQNVALTAASYPLRSIVIVGVLASALSVTVLESGFLEPSHVTAAHKIDIDAFAEGSSRLHLGPETAWKWQVEEIGVSRKASQPHRDDLSLVTLDFLPPGNLAHYAPPSPQTVPLPEGSSAAFLHPTANVTSHVSPDSSLAFSIPFGETAQFLAAVQEIPAENEEVIADQDESDDEQEQKRWLMKSNAQKDRRPNGIVEWVLDSWTAFWDLVEHADTLDIVIMTLGYLSMDLTFISLFLSMRRMGSNFWLATSVLFSSAFAFLFGLVVTLKMGVPENVVLLSEGIPFLVVTVGFEKPIVLTQAVLSASTQTRSSGKSDGKETLTIRTAIQTAVRERGFEIVRDYVIEILILCAGTASGIQGGLRQFCFLGAWTLFFDCILLFTFYTAVLSIKLEINRVKRHVALRKALEDDGVSSGVAEKVASSSDRSEGRSLAPSEMTIFGRRASYSSISRFKAAMVFGFVLVNALNLCTMPFRGARYDAAVVNNSLANMANQTPVDPFKVAGNGLDRLFNQANLSKRPLSVTVFAPIKYELAYPSVHYATPEQSDWSLFDGDYQSGLFSAVSSKMVQSMLKSFEDPTLGKWVIIALAMSLVLNGYLFNAARWTIRNPKQDQNRPEGSRLDFALPEPISTAAEIAKGRRAAEKLMSAAKPEKSMNGHLPETQKNEEPAKKSTNDHSNVTNQASPTETSPSSSPSSSPERKIRLARQRTREDCEIMLRAKKAPLLTDEELTDLASRGKIPGYALEKTLEDKTRAVKVRRAMVARTPGAAGRTSELHKSMLPYENFDYDRVHGACCENVIGYMPLPVGVAGPLTIDGRSFFLPMATTEGVLVASTSRGCKAINAGGGAVTVVTGDGMTRGPCVGFETLARAAAAKVWLDSPEGQKVMRDAFNSTSRFARLQTLKSTIAGTYVYIRFKTTTGDAMGMNMISKGVENALGVMTREAGFEDMAIISVSGNYCTDKKPAAINWIDGRGKSVVAEAIIPGDVVRNVLKSNVDALVELNIAKNFIGSAMAGSIGGFNAHAANIVTAIFLATGQDPAQNVESSNCITVMKKYVIHSPPPNF